MRKRQNDVKATKRKSSTIKKMVNILLALICMVNLSLVCQISSFATDDEYVAYVPKEKKVVIVANVDEDYSVGYFDAVIKNEYGEVVKSLRFIDLEGYKKIVELEPGTYEFSGVNLADPNNFFIETVNFEVGDKNKHIEITVAKLVGATENETEELITSDVSVSTDVNEPSAIGGMSEIFNRLFENKVIILVALGLIVLLGCFIYLKNR